MELIYSFFNQKESTVHIIGLTCGTHIDPAHAAYFILPAVPDIVLSDNESRRFKQLTMCRRFKHVSAVSYCPQSKWLVEHHVKIIGLLLIKPAESVFSPAT